MNVGKLPVVMPFKRCNVVVGASAINLYKRLLFGWLDSNSANIGNLFSYGNGFELSGSRKKHILAYVAIGKMLRITHFHRRPQIHI